MILLELLYGWHEFAWQQMKCATSTELNGADNWILSIFKIVDITNQVNFNESSD